MNRYILGIILLILAVILYRYYKRSKTKPSTSKLSTSQPSTIRNENDIHTNLLKIEFVPSNEFVGRKDGYVFKTGEYGLGYYMDN